MAGLLGVLTTGVVAWAAWRSERELVRAEFERHASAHLQALERRVGAAMDVLLAVEGLWASSRDVERAEFSRFVIPMLERHPEIRAIEWAPRVDDLGAFSAAARAEGLPTPWRRGPSGEHEHVERASPIFPIWYAEPDEANSPAIGYDLGSEPLRAETLARAGAELRTLSTPPLTPVQDPGRLAVLVIEPIHRQDTHETPSFSDDTQEVIGFALTLLDLQTLLELADQDAGIPEMRTTMHVGDQVDSAPAARSRGWEQAELADALRWTGALALPGRELAVSYRATPSFRAHAIPPETAAALLTGLALTTALVLYLSRSSAQTARLREVSEELRATNASLQDQIQERHRAEEALRALNDELGERVMVRTADLLRQGEALVRANQRLGDSEAQLRLLLEHFAGAAWTVDEDLRVLFGTGALCEQLLGPLEGSPPLAAALRDPALVGPILDAHRRALLGEEVALELSAGARVFDLRVGRSDPRLGGALVAVALDVTERRRLERERWEARRQAEERLQSLGMLAGGVAHDFNNLLTTVLGNTGLAILGSADRPEVLGYLQRVELAAQRAAELTKGLLSYAGRGQEPLAPVDARALLAELPTLAGPGPTVALDLPAELPPVAGDATQLRRLLLNLVKNAREALRSAEARVAVSARVCELTRPDALEDWTTVPPAPGTYMRIAVEDDGVGMDEATRRRIFEPFFSTKSAGRGFGLAEALGLLRRHEGGIRVQSAPGRGTRVEVYLPLASAAAHPPAPSVSLPPRRGATVLVVDDEQPIRELVRTVLVQAGFEVVEAVDGAEAVDRVAAESTRYAAVLLDMMMPRMNGAEALEAIRRLAPRLPVVLSSGYLGGTLPEQLAETPALRHLPKPYRASELVRVLRESVEASRAG